MRTVWGFFLYRIGYDIHPLTLIHEGAEFYHWRPLMTDAARSLGDLINEPLLNDKISLIEPRHLLNMVLEVLNRKPPPQKIDALTAKNIQGAVARFENVFASEFSRLDLFLVLTKNGFNTRMLINEGEKFFPRSLLAKVPEVNMDVADAMRCIAFALPTAAGFHLHRANESVLRRYWDAVTDGKPRPTRGADKHPGNMGDYLADLEKDKAGDEKVISALRSLKDLHRNPLMHPEQSLTTTEEAIALHGAVNSVITEMLKVIPDESPAKVEDTGLALSPNDKVMRVSNP